MTLSDLRSARRTIVLATLSLAPVALAAPDSIWIADVVTVDDARPRAEAVAVDKGKEVNEWIANSLNEAV